MADIPIVSPFTDAEKARAQHLCSEQTAQLIKLEIIVLRPKLNIDDMENSQQHVTYKLVRRWASIPDGDRPLLEAFLKTRSGSLLIDPMADREVRKGRWLVNKVESLRYVERDGEYSQGIYETLIRLPDEASEEGPWNCEKVTFTSHVDSYPVFQSPTLLDLEHEEHREPGVIWSVNGSLDTETGLWNYEVQKQTAFTGIQYSWWNFDRYTLSKRTVIVNASEPTFPEHTETTAPITINTIADTTITSLDGKPGLPSGSVVLTIQNWDYSGNKAPEVTGYLKEVNYRLNEFGLFDVEITEKWAISYMHRDIIDHPHYYECIISFRNWQEDPLPKVSTLWADGEYYCIERSQISMNEFGLFDGSLEYHVAHLNKLYTSWYKVGGTNVEDIERGYNFVELPEQPVVTYGDSPKETYSLQFEPNKFGLYDYTKVHGVEYNPYDGSDSNDAWGAGGKRWDSPIKINEDESVVPLYSSEVHCCASLKQAAALCAPHAGSCSISTAGEWWIATLWHDESEGTRPA